MGLRGYDENDYYTIYIVSLYFVTTTLSTCGFGDISATPNNVVENISILLLQFVGLLFYSFTIKEIQILI